MQIGALSILGILPINLTEFWQGSPAGRRKKRRVTANQSLPPPHVAQATKEIGLKLLSVITQFSLDNLIYFRTVLFNIRVTLSMTQKYKLKKNLWCFKSFDSLIFSFSSHQLYKRLDQNQCGFRALCELQNKVICDDYDKQRLPQATQLVLTTFLR